MLYENRRGIRNNNPGNLEFDPNITWDGQVGVDGPYLIFATPQKGIRAMTKNLVNQQKLHGLNTVADIITKYAPPNENDTAAYIADVANKLGVNPNQAIDVASVAPTFVQAIIKHENGVQPYDLATLNQGLVSAGVNAATVLLA